MDEFVNAGGTPFDFSSINWDSPIQNTTSLPINVMRGYIRLMAFMSSGSPLDIIVSIAHHSRSLQAGLEWDYTKEQLKKAALRLWKLGRDSRSNLIQAILTPGSEDLNYGELFGRVATAVVLMHLKATNQLVRVGGKLAMDQDWLVCPWFASLRQGLKTSLSTRNVCQGTWS
jgi:hypothetical protein